MTVKQLTPEADEAVSSLIEAFRLWLQQLVWLPGCLVTDVTDAATGWIVCRITADAGATVAGANQRCRWRQLFEIAANDVVDVIYDPRTMMFEIFKPGGATGVATHDLLGVMHADTTTDAPTQGSMVRVDATPEWDELVLGTARQILQVDGVPTTFAWASFDWDLVAAAAAADMVHDHSAAGEGGQLDWDNIWSDAVHDHSAAGEGGQLDWDAIWSDAVHDHSAAGEGGDALNPETISPQTFIVGPGCPNALLGQAVADINTLGDAAANKLYFILMLGGNFAEAGAVTIPSYVHVCGAKEGTEIEMGANRLTVSSHSSLTDVVVESTAAGTNGIIYMNNVTNVELRNVHGIQSLFLGYIFSFDGSSVAKCYDCVAEGITSTFITGFYATDTADVELYRCQTIFGNTNATGFHFSSTSTGLLEHCIADDATNIATALTLAAAANTVTSRYCTFVATAAGNDVNTGVGSTWNHLLCRFDPGNSTIAGTEAPLVTGNIHMGDGATIGQAAGPLITFDDTLNYLEIMGCRVGIGTATPAAPLDIVGTVAVVRLQRAGGAVAGNDARFALLRSRGGLGTEAIVANNDYLGRINFSGYDGADYWEAGGIYGVVDGAPGVNVMPGRLDFWTNPGAQVPSLRMTINSGGHTYPGSNKGQDLGLATNRWREIFCSAALNTGTSRLVPVQKDCSVCQTQLVRGTGGLRVLGEESDFLLAFCPNCGTVAMIELQHRTVAITKPAPKIVFTGMDVLKHSGNTKSVTVNFRYGDDVEDKNGIVQKALHNSTVLSDNELAAFLAMTDKEREAFLLNLGQIEWEALEKMRIIEAELDAEQAQIDSLIEGLIGKDLLEEG